MMPTDFKDLLSLAPPVILFLLLNLAGMFLKKIPPFPNWLIPITLSIMGGIVYPLIAERAKVNFECRLPIALEVIQGAALGGLATVMHHTFTTLLTKLGLKIDDDQPKPPDPPAADPLARSKPADPNPLA